MSASSVPTDLIKPVLDAAISEQSSSSGSLFMNFIDWSINLIIYMVKIVVMFTTMSVGMTYWN